MTLEEIAGDPVVVPSFGVLGLQGGREPLRYFGIEANAAIAVRNWAVVEHYVAAGLGVAICPSFCVSAGSGVSVVPLGQYGEAELRLVHADREAPLLVGPTPGRSGGGGVLRRPEEGGTPG